jgi:hypothetical protein
VQLICCKPTSNEPKDWEMKVSPISKRSITAGVCQPHTAASDSLKSACVNTRQWGEASELEEVLVMVPEFFSEIQFS